MPVDPMGFEQYNYDSIKYIYQDRNPNACPYPHQVEPKKFEKILDKKTDKAKKDQKKRDKDPHERRG